MKIILAFLLSVLPGVVVAQDVFEVNHADVIVFPNLPPYIAASATGYVELSDAAGKPVVIKTRTFAQIEQEMPDSVSHSQRKDWRHSQYASLISSIHASSPENVFNAATMPMLSKLAAEDSGRLLLQIDDQQLSELNVTLKEYRKAVQDAFKENQEIQPPMRQSVIHEELRKINAKFAVKVKDLINEDQLRMLARWSPHQVGITKLLTETPVGNLLGLENLKKEKLRSETDQIIDQLKKDIEQARVKLEKTINSSLTDLQRDSIEETFGPIVEKQIRESTVVELIRLMDYPDKKQ